MYYGNLALGLLVLAFLPAYAQTPSDHGDLAFAAAQRLANSTATHVIAERAMIDAAEPELAGLMRERRQTAAALEAVRKAISSGVEPGDVGRNVQARRLQLEGELVVELAALNAQIEARHSTLADMLRPQSLHIAEVQELLAAGEAMVLLVPTDEESFIFAITPEAFRWERVELTAGGARELVQNIRGSLVAEQTSRGRPLAPSQESTPNLSSFDGEAAYQLFDAYLAPVRDILAASDTVYAVKSGPLRAVPLGIVLSEPPDMVAGFVDLSASRFLIEDVAIGELPSVASLRTLKCRAGASVSGCVETAHAASPAPEDFIFLGVGGADLDGASSTQRAMPPELTGTLADPALLNQLAPLPGTLAELAGIEAVLPPHTQRSILTSELATEYNLRERLLPILTRANLVVFATHGLIGTEISVRGVAEPGLVLTPPSVAPTEVDDGYLAASEIAALDLRAELIILSACNTLGSVEATEGDGIGALSQAFFAAGADAVLASHWAVEDAATADLMARVVSAHVDGANGPQALRTAILQMRRARPELAPFQWGGFSYVGVKSGPAP